MESTYYSGYYGIHYSTMDKAYWQHCWDPYFKTQTGWGTLPAYIGKI